MATAPQSATEHRESREHEKTGDKSGDKIGKSQMVIVDLEESQSPAEVKRLHRGKGRLFHHLERIVNDLVADGTVKSASPPVVIVVREVAGILALDSDDDDD
jgi:hypothetical protein